MRDQEGLSGDGVSIANLCRYFLGREAVAFSRLAPVHVARIGQGPGTAALTVHCGIGRIGVIAGFKSVRLRGPAMALRCAVVMRGGKKPLAVLCRSSTADESGVRPPMACCARNRLPHRSKKSSMAIPLPGRLLGSVSLFIGTIFGDTNPVYKLRLCLGPMISTLMMCRSEGMAMPVR